MTGRQIVQEVAASTGVAAELMCGPLRKPWIVVARNEAMFRCRNEAGMSLPQIGRLFNRHHTSVMNSLNNHCAGAKYTHIEQNGKFAPPYKGWTLCGRQISTSLLVGAGSQCPQCQSLQQEADRAAIAQSGLA